METYCIVRVRVGSETCYGRYAGGYELTPCFGGDAYMYRVRFRAEAMAGRYKARGYEVDICKLEFKGSYEV